jgi:sec-independent protein translocase protein TatB
MFGSLGWGEFLALAVIALFVFGPDRLPKVAREAGRMVRQLREMANGARNQLRSELGPEFADLDFDSLNPRTFVRKHLFDDDDLLGSLDNPLGPLGDSPLGRNPLREPPRATQPPLAEDERPPFDAEAT